MHFLYAIDIIFNIVGILLITRGAFFIKAPAQDCKLVNDKNLKKFLLWFISGFIILLIPTAIKSF